MSDSVGSLALMDDAPAMQIVPSNGIADLPSEILYEIIGDPLAEYFHDMFMADDPEQAASSWDALAALMQVNTMFREVASKVVSHALGTSRGTDGSWDVSPRTIMSIMRAYICACDNQVLNPDDIEEYAQAVPATPMLNVYKLIVSQTKVASNPLNRVLAIAQHMPVGMWSFIYPEMLKTTLLGLEAPREIPQEVLRHRAVDFVLDKCALITMVGVLLDIWKVLHKGLKEHERLRNKPLDETTPEQWTTIYAVLHKVVSDLEIRDVMYAHKYKPHYELYRIVDKPIVPTPDVTRRALFVVGLLGDLRTLMEVLYDDDVSWRADNILDEFAELMK